MIQLTDFDKYFLNGRLSLITNKDEDALNWFLKALAIKEDPEIYKFIAYIYRRERKYKKAQEYALKAINSGYDCYSLFTRISIDNLGDVNIVLEVLEEGARKHIYGAYLKLAHLCINNYADPDMVTPFKASEYLELAFEYCEPEQKGKAAFDLYNAYECLYRMHPHIKKWHEEDRYLKYLKMCNSYGNPLGHQYGIVTKIFDEGYKNNDSSVIKILFEKLDAESLFIFSLLLLEEELNNTGTLDVSNGYGIYVAKISAKKNKDSGCYSLCALHFGSDFKNAVYNPKKAKRLLKLSKEQYFAVPNCYKDFYDKLMEHLFKEITDESNIGEA